MRRIPGVVGRKNRRNPDSGCQARGRGLKLSRCETCMIVQPTPTPESDPETQRPAEETPPRPAPAPPEIGGRGGLEPTRYGDWEKNGRCIDF
ncbi:DUF1674 domain-containing protein [Xanthomonas albilineans]